jgi:YD repeat-containing protein
MPGTATDTGLRHTVTDKEANVTTYGYDALDRLKTAVTKNLLGLTTADYAYGYDAAGNRTSETLNGVVTIALHNDAVQLDSRAGVTYGYDANGNQTGSSAGAALAYNAANQTTTLQKAGGSPLAASYAGAG